jgi:hypothetical protein
MGSKSYDPVDVGGIDRLSVSDGEPPEVAAKAHKFAQYQSLANSAALLLSAVLLALILAKAPVDDRGGGGAPGAPPVGSLDSVEWASLGGDAAPMPMFLHTTTGRIWVDVAGVLGADLMLVEQVTQGVGIRGLWDAGSFASQNLVQLVMEGPKVLLKAMQTSHRSSDAGVASSVEQSFANSVLWAFEVRRGHSDGLWVDLTDWALRDADGGGLIGSLAARGGNYRVSPDRSVLAAGKSKSRAGFACVEANLTYVDEALSGGTKSALRKGGLADPTAITVALRRSFVKLPDANGPAAFTPRLFTPKSSFGVVEFTDEAAPLLAERTTRWSTVHPIGGVTPGRPLQRGGHGITYYLDAGCPARMARVIVEVRKTPSWPRSWANFSTL